MGNQRRKDSSGTVPVVPRTKRDFPVPSTANEESGGAAGGRLGYTTGACAAAAAKAAVQVLLEGAELRTVEIPFPRGERHALPLVFARRKGHGAEAAVRKDAGDDPDITHEALVVVFVEWTERDDVVFAAGEGVGTVTKKGLTVPPGEPAINPGPRKMICKAVRELTHRPVRITVSIPGGREMAAQTYNPRLGIVEGLSVLGTTGRVRPFSCQALRCALVCELDVAASAGVTAPVLVPGHIGEHSARRHLSTSGEQVVEVGNEWGFVLERIPRYPFSAALLWGHPGKLAKLADEQWDTHSSRSTSAVETVRRVARDRLSLELAEETTTEGLFAALDEMERTALADAVCAAVVEAVRRKSGGAIRISAALANMEGDVLGTHGDLARWLRAGKSKLTIVGCGPGSPDYLTEAGRRAIARAKVLVGAARLLDLHATPAHERIHVGSDIEGVLAAIAARGGEDAIAVLVSGDPGLCSLATPVLRRFGAGACEVIPGVSSVQLAFARVGVDWLDARIVSAHKGIPNIAPGDLATSDKIAILGGPRHTQGWIADLADALGGGRSLVVCEDLSMETEKVRRVSSSEFRQLDLSSRTIVLLLKEDHQM